MKPLKITYYLLLAAIVVVALLLIASALPIPGNFRVLTVLSGSMEPAIKTGAVVIVKPANNYKKGDIITFGPITKEQNSTSHRIYDVKVIEGMPVYITKGDANNAPDEREVLQREVIGKVLFSIPYVGRIIEWTKKPIGFILIIAIPAMVIIYDETRKIWQEIIKLKNKDKDKEQDKKIERLEKELNKIKKENR